MIKFILAAILAVNSVFAGTQNITPKTDLIDGLETTKNFMGTKGHFEKNVGSFAAYADAAGASPVDGTAGSPASTCTRTTSSPIAGEGSLLITKSAANRQGEGCSVSVAIDSDFKAKVLSVRFKYQVGSGTFVAGTATTDSDVTVWLYDVTNSTLIQPSSHRLMSNSTTLAEDYQAEFQTAVNSTSYRLIFHISTTSASAYTLKIDDIGVSRSTSAGRVPLATMYAYKTGGAVTANTAWTTFTATVKDNYGGFNATTGLYTVVSPGDYFVAVTAASGGTSNVKIKRNGTDYIYGPQSSNRTTASGLLANMNAGDTISVCLDGSQTLVSDTISNTFSVAQVSAASNGDGARVVSFHGVMLANAAVTANVTDFPFTSERDSHGAWSGSVYTVPVTGDYQITLTCLNGAAVSTSVYKNASLYRRITGCDNAAWKSGSLIVPNLKVGDTLSVRSDTTVTFTGAANGQVASSLSVFRLSGPTSVAASETVAASYWLSANFVCSTTIPCNFDSKDIDTHNAVTTSATAWKFTAPMAGIYQVNVSMSTATAIYWKIYKNGVLNKNIVYDGGTADANGLAFIQLTTGDYIDIRPTSGTPTVTGGIATADATAAITIFRLGGTR